MDLQKTIVIANEMLAPSCFRISLECRPPLSEAVPGQFVMVRVETGNGPFWRRPFSVAGLVLDGGLTRGIELIYKVVGKATAAMSALKPGRRLDLLGPLGHGFELSKGLKPVFLAAGGIGIAPVRFLAQVLEKYGHTGELHFFLGGRSSDDLLCRKELESMSLELHLATDDGSVGHRGLLTEPLERQVESLSPGIIYACGPTGMLVAVADIARRHDCNCQVAVETLMACGMGACQGCALPDADRSGFYLHVCQDGPVFDASKVVLA